MPTLPRQRSRAVDGAVLLLATGFAAGLVLFQLGTKAVWLDEATTWGTASQHGASLWHWLLHDGGNMLGYYAGMHVVVGLFGSRATVLRLPTAICFVGTTPCCYLLLRRLYDRRTATFGAFFVPASASLVLWGQEARGYGPAVLGVTAGALALVVAVQDRRRLAWAAFVVCSVFAAYMLLLSVLVVVAEVAALALVPRGELQLRRAAVSVGATLVLWAPLGAAALHRGSGQIDWISRPGLADYKEFGRFLVGAPSGLVLAVLITAVFLAGVLLAARDVVRSRRAPEGFAAGLLLAWVVVPIVILLLVSIVQPLLIDRYLLASVPAAAMLPAVVCAKLRPRALAFAAAAALVVIRVFEVAPQYGVSIEDWPAATTVVADHFQPHDCIAFFVADGFTAFDYYELRLPASRRLPDPVLPEAQWSAKTPFVLDPATLSPSEWQSMTNACPRLWLVETHQQATRPGPGVPSYQALKYVASQRLSSELSNSYVVLKSWSFKAVLVELYVRDRLIAA